jgi:hypothetical protein
VLLYNYLMVITRDHEVSEVPLHTSWLSTAIMFVLTLHFITTQGGKVTIEVQ